MGKHTKSVFNSSWNQRVRPKLPRYPLNIMMPSFQYMYFRFKNKTVVRPSYLHNRNPKPGKTAFILKQCPCLWGHRCSPNRSEDIMTSRKGNVFHITYPCWRSIVVTSVSPFNSSPPGQNGRHLGRWHFQLHFLEWKWQNSDSNFIEICSQWSNWHHWSGDKPLPGPMMTQSIDAYMRHQEGRWVKAE